jgi:hypothetical protein
MIERRAAEHASVTQLRELQEQLGAANSLKAQLSHAVRGGMQPARPSHRTAFAHTHNVVRCTQLAATSTAGEEARQEVAVLTRQLDGVQTALDAAETDRQVLAAQRDGWMASFQVGVHASGGVWVWHALLRC